MGIREEMRGSTEKNGKKEMACRLAALRLMTGEALMLRICLLIVVLGARLGRRTKSGRLLLLWHHFASTASCRTVSTGQSTIRPEHPRCH